MRKILKFLAQALIAILLIIGIYKSYGLYKQNKIQRRLATQIDHSQKHFTIIVSAYNNSKSCEKNLFSILTQNYDTFRVVYIDDGSTDHTLEIAQKATLQSPQREKVSFLRNKEPSKSLETLYKAIHSCKDHEIILLVDGHDFLAHENVLSKLSKIYAKPSTWMTYGNFLDYPSYRQIPVKCKQFPKNVVFNNSFRSHEVIETHLKTFYAGLFKQIQKEDLFYEGKFISKEAPLAYLIPLLEMSGKHAHFINEVLYLHTRSAGAPPTDYLNHIRTLPKYKRLKMLPFETSEQSLTNL